MFRCVSLLAAAICVPLACAESLVQNNCRRSRSTSDRAADWSFDGQGGLSASFSKAGTGSVTLTCTVLLSNPATSITLSHAGVLVSFLPAGSKNTGSGLQIRVGDRNVSYLRVAGEDWIEAGKRTWNVNLPAPTRRVEVRIAAIDNSAEDPMRIDLKGVSISVAPVRTPQP